MERNWAAEHLQVIRTLMERSAIYRRALAPIVLLLGFLALGAATVGWIFRINSPRGFGFFWSAVSVVGVCGAYIMVRRQALKERDIFWSPPTRRVTQAVLPPLFAGSLATALTVYLAEANAPTQMQWMPAIWMVLYGCALHAAGFFMPRGMKLFGWIFILSGSAAAVQLAIAGPSASMMAAHALMGFSFGGLHLAYGVYLYFTESRKNET